ncbi:uncharacterized protein TRAVEDRAFT_49631 [Trametes versicolor FP-101664 SS1]|uniref:uncharacterized protein n=1 Tax=Trametes versicolor (strain FP-101664) TaxID=717944 RepID=UPI0004623D22|nr:uncharacterized protein TRAVEDRAFT_49631 [Trametes versicolor FP-101664 SS1]EIW56809.1 hypothetical protein TRAVEDRAFT_49631 [Trametes versicolor FP-101664 SS1]
MSRAVAAAVLPLVALERQSAPRSLQSACEAGYACKGSRKVNPLRHRFAERRLREEDHVEQYVNTNTRKALIQKCQQVPIRQHAKLMWENS